MSSSGETVQDGPQEYIYRFFRTLTGATTEFWSGASSPTSPPPAATTRETPLATVSVISVSSTIPNEDYESDAGRILRRETTTGMARRKSVDSARNTGSLEADLTQGAELQRTTSTTSSAKRRLSIAEKLKKLGKEINVLRKGSTSSSNREKGIPASPVTTTSPPALPPAPVLSPVVGGHAKLLSMVDEGDESVEATPSKPPPPEPESLAKKIQDLIDSMPFPQPGEGKSIPIVKNPKPPARDKDGRPIPPPNATPVKDSKLLAFLSSATIMNGSDTGRRSIWSVLESLGVPPHGFPPTNDKDEERTTPPDSGEGGHDTDGDGSPDIFADTSSVMVYSPLIPDRKDLVELAELVDLEGNSVDGGSSYPVAGTSWGQVWPLSAIWNSSSIANASGDTSPVIHRVSSEVVISGTRTGVDGNGNPVRIRTARAWVPSDTKLSVQAMWWGYRLYLPPPVLEILDDKTLEATKRAAMITTALTWFFNNLPINSLPIAVRPALLLLQRIAPFVGYIGTFISWSWKTVKSYDVGFGVTLTATWLLPIALIPGTWNEYDFPKSPSPASPIPLPPVDLPSSPPPTSPSLPPTSPPPATPSNPATPPTSPAPAPTNPTPLPTPAPEPPAQLPTPAPTEPSTTLPPDSPPPTPAPPILAPSASTDTTSSVASKLSKWKRLVTSIPATSSPSPTLTTTAIAHTAASRPPLSALDTSASGPHSPTPPVPMEVPPSSPLAKRLLQGPMMNPVPLPDENAPMPKFKERVRGVFKKRQNVDLN